MKYLVEGLGTERSVRDALGEELVELGELYLEMVVLGADLDNSTKAAKFREKYGTFCPESRGGRFESFGVAEQSMVAAAAGHAAARERPIATTFAVFLLRGYEPIRQTIGIPGLDVKLIGTHAGISTGQDGSSAQAIEDIGCMRMIPGMSVLSPADYTETRKAMRRLMEYKGPAYMRLSRNNLPDMFGDDYAFEIGKPVEIVEGERRLTIFSTGETSKEAWKAAKLLQKEKVYPTVVHMPTIEPINSGSFRGYVKGAEIYITVEDHNVIGGLGDAVRDAIDSFGMPEKPFRFRKIGLKTYAESGKPADLYRKYGLDSEAIYLAGMEELERLKRK